MRRKPKKTGTRKMARARAGKFDHFKLALYEFRTGEPGGSLRIMGVNEDQARSTARGILSVTGMAYEGPLDLITATHFPDFRSQR